MAKAKGFRLCEADKDPADNKVKVILNGATISEVFTDENGNERATILDDIVKAEDEVKE